MTDVCSYPRCTCIVSTSTSQPEPKCPRGWQARSPDFDYLRGLAERLMEVLVIYGVNGEDIDRVSRLARRVQAQYAALREIETICTETVGECRKRMGTRLGNTLVAAREGLAEGREP